MLPGLVLLFIITIAVVAFVLGRASTERVIGVNHHKLAVFAMMLLNKDETLAFMAPRDRDALQRLVNDYARIDAVATNPLEKLERG